MRNFFPLLMLLSVPLYGQKGEQIPMDEAYKRVYNITKSVEGLRPTIDGRLDDEFWTVQGEWTVPFVQVSPYERFETDNSTIAKIIYDDESIYIAVYCKSEDPESINRFIDNRDANNIGDLVSIAFDTYHDFSAAAEFNINAGGNKTDLVVTDQKSVNRSWNAVWEGRTSVNEADSSWVAEMRIPFSQLRYNQDSEDGIWGLHIRRIIRENNETQNWSLIPLKNNGHLFSFGEMHGMTALPKPKSIEILPYVLGKSTIEPKIEGSPYQTGSSLAGNMGLDGKVILGDYTMDITINPDFGQVELDPSVMNLTAYETYYDEKRPFFLEGKYIMDFNNGGDQMFYSRRIGSTPSYTPSVDNTSSFRETQSNVPIIGAAKITGTNSNGLTIGITESITAKSLTSMTTDGVESEVLSEPLTNFSVARLQQNWDGNTILGGMVASVNRILDDDNMKKLLVKDAFTGGVDFTQYFSDRLYYIDLKAMASTISGSEESILRRQRNSVHYYQRLSAHDYLGVDNTKKSLSGSGGYLKLGRKGNAKFTFSESVSWSTPGFDLNDVGYQKVADFITSETELGYKQTVPWKIFRSNTFTMSQTNSWNFGGENTLGDIDLSWATMFTNKMSLTLKGNYTWLSLDTRQLRGGPDVLYGDIFKPSVSYKTDASKRIVAGLNYSGSFNAEIYNVSHTISPDLSMRVWNNVMLTVDFEYVDKIDNQQYVASVMGDYLVGSIHQKTYGITASLQVNVTPDLSLQFYGAPFTSVASYNKFKVADNTTSESPEERFSVISDEDISYNEADNRYELLYGGSFVNPDFSFNQFKSNFVLRWEYLPGSTIYFVWEYNMSDRGNIADFNLGNNIDRLFGLPSTNTFMVKVNYWFSL